MPATPPRNSAVVATEETERGKWGGDPVRVRALHQIRASSICIYLEVYIHMLTHTHMPATSPRKATLVATEETEKGESGGDTHVGMRERSVWAREGLHTVT